MVSCPGAWKNFDELEENLTMKELDELLSAARKLIREQNKFLAALKGINLDDKADADVPSFEDVKRRAEARLRGRSEEEVGLAEIGVGIEEWD